MRSLIARIGGTKANLKKRNIKRIKMGTKIESPKKQHQLQSPKKVKKVK